MNCLPSLACLLACLLACHFLTSHFHVYIIWTRYEACNMTFSHIVWHLSHRHKKPAPSSSELALFTSKPGQTLILVIDISIEKGTLNYQDVNKCRPCKGRVLLRLLRWVAVFFHPCFGLSASFKYNSACVVQALCCACQACPSVVISCLALSLLSHSFTPSSAASGFPPSPFSSFSHL